MKRWKKSAVLVITAMMMTGCGGDQAETDMQTEESTKTETANLQDTQTQADALRDTAVFADTQAPTSLDLTQSWNSWYTSRYGITETLYKLDNNLEAQPFLAESCEQIDDTTWKITIKEGITFQNENPLTAEAVKRCWERTMEKNARFNELLFIDSMSADDQVLTVKTTKPVTTFISALTEPLTGIIDVTAQEDPETHPIGTGPFCAVSYEVKSKCEVERYEDYWGGTPKLKHVTFQVISDPSAMAMAQQSGEIDLSVSIPSTSLALFEDTSKYVIDGVAGSRGQVIYLNFENEFLQDEVIRKAINKSIDKENYAEILNHNASVSTTGLYPDFMEFGGAQSEKYDLEGAKQLLEDAGYTDSDGDGIAEKDGKNIELTINTYSTKAELVPYCEELASKLGEIGISLEVDTTDYDTLVEYERTGEFDMMMISTTMCPTGNAQYFADLAFRTDGSMNYGHYSNPEVDSLIDELDQEFDVERQAEIAKEIQQKVVDDTGYIVVGHSKFIIVYSTQVKGFQTNPSEYYLLDANVWIEG